MLNYIAVVAAFCLVGVDQLIKYIVVLNMQPYDTIPIINGVLHITYIQNRGAVFGIMQGQVWLLSGVTSIVILAALFLLLTRMIRKPAVVWCTSLIIAGGIGNLIDRVFRGDQLFHGFVVDYIDFRLINFAVFNFADSCVVIGTSILLIYLLFFDKGDSFVFPQLKKQTITEPSECHCDSCAQRDKTDDCCESSVNQQESDEECDYE